MNTVNRIIRDKTYLYLLLIFLLASFLRFHNLGTVPHGLHDDEIANAYVGHFTLLNGVDLYGNKWPLLYFDKFGDFPPIIPMYISAIGTFIFGNNIFGARAAIALIGALFTIPVFFLAFQIYKNRRTALFASLLAAILPWQLALSRVNAEGVIALTIFALGLMLLLISLIKNKTLPLVVAALFFLSTYFIYPSYRLIIPLLFLPVFILMYLHKTSFRFKTASVIIFAVLLLTAFYINTTDWGRSRFMQTSVFSPSSDVMLKIHEFTYNEDNIFLARLFNNKIVGYVRGFLTQYFSYFSPNFFFIQGGLPKLYQIANSGLLYISLIPLFLFAMLGKFQKENKDIRRPLLIYFIFILLVAPVASAITIIDTPNTHRSLPMLLPIIMLAAYGFNSIRNLRIKKLPVWALLSFILLGEFIFFFHNYFQHESFFTSLWRNDGNKEAMEYAIQNRNKYNTVYVTNQQKWLPVYYLFNKGDYDKKYAGKFKHDFRIPAIDNLKFIEAECPSSFIMDESRKMDRLAVPEKSLIIDSANCAYTPSEMKLFKVNAILNRVNHTRAFHILTVNPGFSPDILKAPAVPEQTFDLMAIKDAVVE